MDKPVVAALILPYNSKGEVLLQLRDEEPGKGTWVPFGGAVEEGETLQEALRRELMEELEWKLEGPVGFVGSYPPRGIQDRELQVFYAPLENLDGLVLHEGDDLRFFSKEEIAAKKNWFDYSDILDDFYNIIKEKHAIKT